MTSLFLNIYKKDWMNGLKWIDAKLRIAAGFNVKAECEIDAEIRKGTVILGKVKK